MGYSDDVKRLYDAAVSSEFETLEEFLRAEDCPDSIYDAVITCLCHNIGISECYSIIQTALKHKTSGKQLKIAA